jgi:ribosomal protein S18 acetylase RimI-like enzyme
LKFVTKVKNFSGLRADGFFIGWPKPPSEDTLKRILIQGQHFVLAIDGNKIVGFINAISDKTLSAYIPLLEVLPEYQGKGIGKVLVNKMKEELSSYYMIDISCDDSVVKFFQGLVIRLVKSDNF